MRLIDYLLGTANILKKSNIVCMTADDLTESYYTFANSNGKLTPKQVNFFTKEINETAHYGTKSSICKNIKFEKTKNFDIVVFYKDKNTYVGYPTKLRELVGNQIAHDLVIYYNKNTKEYNIKKVDSTNITSSKLTGNIKVLEMFLNYSLGGLPFNEPYNLLKTSKDYTINGINLKREKGMVKLTITSQILKECMNNLECTITNEAFDMLIDHWYMKPINTTK